MTHTQSPASPQPEAAEPVAQAPAQAGEVARLAQEAKTWIAQVAIAGHRHSPAQIKVAVEAMEAFINRLAALAAQPLAAPESIGWAAFDTRENRMRTRCETLEQIEAYIQQQHQSRDDITLYKRPIFAGDRS